MANSTLNNRQMAEAHRTHEIKRVTWGGLIVNLFLTVFKFVCGTVGASQAVVADAVHSLSDTGTDVVILVGVRYWTAPADDSHPHGHRRIETVITTFFGLLLAAVAIGLVYRALTTLSLHPEAEPGWIAFVAAVVALIVKEALYRWTIAVGKRIKSSVVIANAWEHRSDAYSSIPAALAVAGTKALPAWSFLDHVGAVVVSVLIIEAAWRILAPALNELVDRGAPQKDCEQVKQIVLGTDGVRRVHAIRTRYVGSSLQVDLHIEVDSTMTVRQGHDIAGAVKHRLIAEGPDVLDVTVHVEPYKVDGQNVQSPRPSA